MKLIEVNNIEFSYNQTANPIFKDLSFSIEKGSFISILGPSGCGKSTLLSLLSGFKSPDYGEILFNGDVIKKPFPEGQIIFQDTGQLLPWLTVEKNILLPRYRFSIFSKNKIIPEDDWKFYKEILNSTDLLPYKNYYPNQLSGGLKQRVSLVRAIFAKSEILFMDEPFVSLDAPSRSDLQQRLLKLWKDSNKTILFVTHDISEALLLSDKILMFPGDKSHISLIDNTFPRPRDKNSSEFIEEKLRLYSIIDSI